MKRLLMLDADVRLAAVVTRALRQEGVEVLSAETVDGARALLPTQRFDAALLDCDLIDSHDLSLFSSLQVLLTTSFLEPEGEHRFFLRAPLLRKPFTSAQLLSALHEVCAVLRYEPAMLVDVLRQAHTRGQSVVLRIGTAEVFLEEGQLVHAEYLGVRGESALAEILARPHRELVCLPYREVARTIHRPFQALVLELLRFVEERERLAPSVAQPKSALGRDGESRS
jgi:DNA-binding response OmpR family regulator